MTDKIKNNELMMEAIDLALFTKRSFKVMAKINIFNMEKQVSNVSTKPSTQISRSTRRKMKDDDDEEELYPQTQIFSTTQDVPVDVAEKIVSMVFTKIKKTRPAVKLLDQKLSFAQKKLIQDLTSNPADAYNHYLYLLTTL